MRIKIIESCRGFGADHAPGEILDLPDEQALTLLDSGRAVMAPPERAVAQKPAENAKAKK